MSADVVIRAEGLGKKYVIGHRARPERYIALRDEIARYFKDFARSAVPFRKRAVTGRDEREEFWALKHVSFEIKRGEVVGVIGRNGAGKSTLLKVLSRITEPSEGRVEIKGRVASLLEVGTGFHPELTGRENIYLNGAILGMPREEIRRKFDEIVAFAEVEKFLDTPVKRYSSGMYVRLAFAVAAHLESEILVVDEVLAVGDAEFQKKCLGKMEHISKGHGRTVLFVSHNMAVIQALCPKTIVLDQGGLRFMGSSAEAAAAYLRSNRASAAVRRTAKPNGAPTITCLEMTYVECNSETEVRFRLEIHGRGCKRCSIEAKVFDLLGVPVGFASVGLLDPVNAFDLRAGEEQFSCLMKLPRMARGTYRLSVQLAIPMIEVIDSTGEGVTFELHPGPLSGYERVLESSWGYGSFEFPLQIEREPLAVGRSFAKFPTAAP